MVFRISVRTHRTYSVRRMLKTDQPEDSVGVTGTLANAIQVARDRCITDKTKVYVLYGNEVLAHVTLRGVTWLNPAVIT